MRDYDCLDEFDRDPRHTHECPNCATLWHGWHCQVGSCDLAADERATCPDCAAEADLATLIEADIRANETPDDYLTPRRKG